MPYHPRLNYDALYGAKRAANAEEKALAACSTAERKERPYSAELGRVHKEIVSAVNRSLKGKKMRWNMTKSVGVVSLLFGFAICTGILRTNAGDEDEFGLDDFVYGHEVARARRLASDDALCQGSDCDQETCRTKERYEDGKRSSMRFNYKDDALLSTLDCPSVVNTNPETLCKRGQPLADGESQQKCTEVCLKASMWAFLFLYLLGAFYMFIAIAIVCDEFFVPSLEVLADKFQMSNDVAGATLMAAGGSMPELITAFVATFNESDVGFAAIVGSAVFNVLFVIGVCGIFSDEPLELQWYPLFRDCAFYLVTLGSVALVMGVSSKNKVETWEALILFLEYVCYCLFMTQSQKVESFLMKKFSKVAPEGEGSKDAQAETSLLKPSTFRVGIVQLLTKHAHVTDTAGIAAVTQIKGNMQETFKQFDKDGDNTLSDDEITEMFKSMGMQDEAAVADELKKILNRNSDGKISFDAFEKWYIASESRVAVEVKKIFEKFDKNGDGTIDETEIVAMLKSLGHHPNAEEAKTALQEIHQAHKAATGDADEKAEESHAVGFDEFYSWYHESLFFKDQKRHNELEEEAAEGYSLDWPEGEDGAPPAVRQIIMYIICYPLAALMYVCLPDVRREGYDTAKWAIIEFAGCLVFIAFFCFCLYEWVVIFANTAGIPSVIAGLVILAPGTSVPDLLSSYVVARQGHGDMAVSSSIGSNIFDVTVGLPIPWLMFCLMVGPVQVQTPGLVSSILVLIGMLAAVLGCIIAMKWRMGKSMGVAMMILYVLFCALMIADNYVPGGVLPQM